MLGPADLRDWDFEEVDAVRAGIRRLPIVRQHIEEPELAGKFLDKVLDVKLRAFNCGIGLVAVADEKHAGHVIDAFQEAGDHAKRIGKLVPGAGEAKVVYRGALKL